MKLKPRIFAAALGLAAIASGPATSGPSQAMRDVTLTTGYADVFTYDAAPVAVILGDADVAAANVTVADVLVLTGRSAGQTNVIVLGEDGSEIDRFHLIVRDVGGAVAERRALSRRVLRCDVPVHEVFECRLGRGLVGQDVWSLGKVALFEAPILVEKWVEGYDLCKCLLQIKQNQLFLE